MIGGALTSSVWQIGTVIPESTNTHARFAVSFLSFSILALGILYMTMPIWGIITIPFVMMSMDLILWREVKRSISQTLQLRHWKELCIYPISFRDISLWIPFLKKSRDLNKPIG
jgi:hypothetical protein